jgi:hypothetical protein
MRLRAKVMTMTIVAALAGGVLQARGAGQDGAHKLTVCMNEAPGLGPSVARLLVAQMFAGIGVGINWRTRLAECPAGALKISLSNKTPETLRPGTLAYALPYEGTHIVVFYDRILGMGSPRSAPHVMAHVMAHEITHILQGIVRHSAAGVMKARWSDDDVRAMQRKPLSFATADVDLIYTGLAYRAAHLAGTATVAANPAAQQ